MNIYETIMIFRPNETVAKEEITKFNELIQSYSESEKVKLEDIGLKKLAYEIKKEVTGYYAIFTWHGTGKNVAELERQMRIDDNVIKFMTVKCNDDDLDEYADVVDEEDEKSEQDSKPDALDVLLGLANY